MKFILLVVAVLCLQLGAQAVTLHVPNEFSSIQAALNAVSARDTVRVADGVYHEHGLQIHAGVFLIGNPEQPEAVTVDADYVDRVLAVLQTPADVYVEGFRFIHGLASTSFENVGTAGEAVLSYESDLELRHCILTENGETNWAYNCFALECEGYSTILLKHCEFTDNLCSGVKLVDEVGAIVDTCRIEKNYNGLLYESGRICTIRCCSISENRNYGLHSYGDNLNLRGSTLAGNQGNGAAVQGGDFAGFSHCLISLNQSLGISCSQLGDAVLGNCNVYGNLAGDYVGCLWDAQFERDNISVDPQFCDPANGDYTLSFNSPCAEANTEDGLRIGALQAACSDPQFLIDFVVGDSVLYVDNPLQVTNLSAPADSFHWDMNNDGVVDYSGRTPANWFYSESGPYSIRLDAYYMGACHTVLQEDVVRVYPSGLFLVPENCATLREATLHVQRGDTISLAPGTYESRNLYVAEGVTIIGRAGAESTILDAMGADFALRLDSFYSYTSAIHGVTIRGAAITGIDRRCYELSLEECLLTDNGSAVYSHSWGHTVIQNCSFVYNHPGEALFHSTYCDSLSLVQCVLAFNGQVPVVEDQDDWNDVSLHVSSTNIYSGLNQSAWSGSLESWRDTLNNIDADPLLTDPANRDFRPSTDSPCLPENNDSGLLMGALPLGGTQAIVPPFFLVEEYASLPPRQVQFRNYYYETQHSFHWDLDGDGEFETQTANPEWTYTEAGPHSVCVRTTTSGQSREFCDPNAVVIGGRNLQVPSVFPSISDALCAAVPGDTVTIAAGVYYEHDLEMGSGILLRGEYADSVQVTIDAQRSGAMLSGYDSDSSCIRDIRFINAMDAMTVRGLRWIRHCEFLNNCGAVSLSGRAPEIDSCSFIGNVSPSWGGAIVGAFLRVSNCSFINNRADWDGGAIDRCYDSSAIIESCLFEGNQADEGGAVNSFMGSIRDCVFLRNRAAHLGGAICRTSSYRTPTVSNCLLAENTAGEAGGAIFCDAVAALENCTLVANNSPSAAAFALDVDDSNASISECLIAFNTGASTFQLTLGEDTPEDFIRNTCIYGNAGGNWTGLAEYSDNGCNMELDPLFCEWDTLWHLQSDSFCRAEHNACDALIGYSDEVCDTKVEESPTPSTFTLYHNWPNPFNPVTHIRVDMPFQSKLSLQVYNLLGQQVCVLHNGVLQAGTHEFSFNGSRFASGVYLIAARTANGYQTQKMLLLK